MWVLALDSATAACSVALWSDGAVRAHRLEVMARGQAEALMPMVKSAMDEAGVSFRDLDLLAVTVGPGAFTGLRIGLSAARGMALATGLPLVGVTTLEAVAHAVPPAERAGRTLLVVLDTKRADVYAQLFSADLAPLGPATALLPDDLPDVVPPAPLVVAGDGVAMVSEVLAAAGSKVLHASVSGLPDAAHVARIAAARAPDGTSPPPAPLYLRPPDAQLPRQGGRVRRD
ncbi:MAG: tRNA (adenosine(37)-N6)-threonylcarbamoyltransferase complex dimerization subunit type 1 TsaB [Alphaproteobacteria bacterium]